jgi:hypothetical protein
MKEIVIAMGLMGLMIFFIVATLAVRDYGVQCQRAARSDLEVSMNQCPDCGCEFDYAWLYDAFSTHDYSTDFTVDCPDCKREGIEITTHSVPEFEVINAPKAKHVGLFERS